MFGRIKASPSDNIHWLFEFHLLNQSKSGKMYSTLCFKLGLILLMNSFLETHCSSPCYVMAYIYISMPGVVSHRIPRSNRCPTVSYLKQTVAMANNNVHYFSAFTLYAVHRTQCLDIRFSKSYGVEFTSVHLGNIKT